MLLPECWTCPGTLPKFMSINSRGKYMFYALICIDKPDSQQLRLDTRPDHRDHLKALGDTLKHAGPFTNEDGSQMNGSLLIVETDSLEEAKAIAESDPYAKAGLFSDVQVRPWNWIIGNPGE